MSKPNEETLVELLDAISRELLRRVKAGKATHQDIANAIKLLNNNGITVEPQRGDPLDILKEELPFHSDTAFTN